MKHIMKCAECSSYTMKEEHCSQKTIPARPAKYSPADKWAEWRRKAKKEKAKLILTIS